MNTLKSLLFSIIIISFSSCGLVDSSAESMKSIDSLNTVLTERESEIEKNLDLLDNIDMALKETNPTQNINVKDIEKVKSIDKEIFDKINTLKDKLRADQIELEKLRTQLAEAKESAKYRKDLIGKVSGKLEEYERENALLKQQVSKETQEISDLTAELEAQGIQISKLKSTLHDLNEDIVELKAELDLGYYLIGTKKELKEDSIISRKGLAGSITLNDNIDKSKFRRLNKRSDNSINLVGFKKVNLVPERPIDSFKMITKDDQIISIEVINQDKFWEVSNYLVVVVK